MPYAQLVFDAAVLAVVAAMAAYAVGGLDRPAMTFVVGPMLPIALAAFVAIQPAPPPPPLSPAEQAKRDAASDGYLLGLASGLLIRR